MAETEGEMHHVGSLIVNCPRCGMEITIPVHAGVVTKPDSPGILYVKTDPDVADYWSHSFWHQQQKQQGQE